MEVVRKVVSADMLTSIIDLPWVSKGMQVEIIVVPHNNKISKQLQECKERKGQATQPCPFSLSL